MNVFILISCFLVGLTGVNPNNKPVEIIPAKEINMPTVPAPELSILFPKNNQKVRGEYKIYGKAKPGSVVHLKVSSTYFKTTRNEGKKIAKGEGPIARMNRKFSLTADRNGRWLLKSIELLNAGWEETFVITATSDKKSVSVRVYDDTRPVRMD